MIKPIVAWIDKFKLILNVSLIIFLEEILNKFGFFTLALSKRVDFVDIVLKKLFLFILIGLSTYHERRINSLRLLFNCLFCLLLPAGSPRLIAVGGLGLNLLLLGLIIVEK